MGRWTFKLISVADGRSSLTIVMDGFSALTLQTFLLWKYETSWPKCPNLAVTDGDLPIILA